MSHYSFRAAAELADADTDFYALIQAAMRRADTDNLARLQAAFPDTWDELDARYHAPAGHLDGDREPALCPVCADHQRESAS